MARQANPRLQSPSIFARSSRQQSSEDFLKQLEELLKLNRGGFSTFAEDTAAQPGFIVPGGIPVRQGQFVPETLGQTGFSNVERPQYPDIPSTTYSGEDTQGMEQSSASQFVDQLNQVMQAPVTPETIEQQTGLSYGIQTLEDGGVLYSDGVIRYEDGTVRDGTANAQPIMQMEDGSIQYSDGSLRRPASKDELRTQDGVDLQAYQDLANYLGYGKLPTEPGQRGLISGIFGDDRVITQAYGNYNPQIEPTGYNIGTDIRTRDLQGEARQLKLPVGARVAEVLYDDGTRMGYYSGHAGYGNSVLLELPTGEMLRFSHLDQMLDVKPGDVINPGEVFGTPGTTGNTYGEHLDLEYYDPSGQLSDPANFSGFTNPESLKQLVGPMSSEDPVVQEIVSRMEGESQETTEPTLLSTLRTARDSGDSLIQSIESQPSILESAQNVASRVGEIPQQVAAAAQPGSPQRQQLASGVEDVAQKTGLDMEAGATEFLEQGKGEEGQRSPAEQARISAVSQQPKIPFEQRDLKGKTRQLMGNVLERVGDVGNLILPGAKIFQEGGRSEMLAGGPTKRTGQALASEIGGEEPQQVPGIRESLQGIGQDLQAGASSAISNVFNPDPEVKTNIDKSLNFIDEMQAGAGIEKLKGGESKSGGAGVNLFSRRSPSDLSPERVVGASSGSNLLPGGVSGASAQMSGAGERDTSDPFFKSSLFQRVKDFVNVPSGEIKNQALSPDVFTPDFYRQPERVGDVFAGTAMEGDALGRATNQIKNAYRQAYSGSEYDQADVERILNQLPANLNYTPDLPEPKKVQRRQPTLNDYLSMGKTAAQYYAETGQQSTLDSIRGNPRLSFDERSGNIGPAKALQAPSVSQVRRQGQTMGSGSQSVTLPSGRVVQAGPGQEIRADSEGSVQSVEKGGTPVKTPSAQLTYNARQSNNGIFNRAKRFASGVFNRFFN